MNTLESPEYWDVSESVECRTTIALAAFLEGCDSVIDKDIEVILKGTRYGNKYYPERSGYVCDEVVAQSGDVELDKTLNALFRLTKANESIIVEHYGKYNSEVV